MRHPPRLSHLATRAVIVSRLVPTYAIAHSLEDEEAASRVDASLRGPLLDQLLDVTWDALRGKAKRLTDDGLLEKVARSLKDRPTRPGRVVELTPGWSAFMLLADHSANIASDAALRILESDEGKKRVAAGLAEVGEYLAKELTR